MLVTSICSLTLMGTALGTYVGCFNKPEVFEGRPVQWQTSGPFDPVACFDTCTAAGTTYFYEYDTFGGDVGIYVNCYCTNTQPGYQYLTEDGLNSCYASSEDVEVSVYTVAPNNWEWEHCYPFTDSFSTEYRVDNIFECLDHCSNSKYARLYFAEDDPEGWCACYNDNNLWANQHWTYCDIGDWNIYINSNPVQPSQLAKKRKDHLNRADRSRRYGDNLIMN